MNLDENDCTSSRLVQVLRKAEIMVRFGHLDRDDIADLLAAAFEHIEELENRKGPK